MNDTQWILTQDGRRVSVSKVTYYTAECYGHPVTCTPQWRVRCGFVSTGEAKLANNLAETQCENLMNALDRFVQGRYRTRGRGTMFSIPLWLETGQGI